MPSLQTKPETEARSRHDHALRARHVAALDLLRRGHEVDGALLLSYVVWPTADLQLREALAAAREASSRSCGSVSGSC